MDRKLQGTIDGSKKHKKKESTYARRRKELDAVSASKSLDDMIEVIQRFDTILLSKYQVAVILGVTEEQVRLMCRRGILEDVCARGRTTPRPVLRESLIAYLRKLRQ